MRRTLLFILGLLTFASAQTQTQAQHYSLKLTLGGKLLQWDAGEGTDRDGEVFSVDDPTEPLVVDFEGGRLELHLADYGTFAQPHVIGTQFSREAEPNTFNMGATVRHNDQGWDDYADTIVFGGTKNGRRTLMHPHDDEQPFTRSQSGVHADGSVRIYALDNVRSGEGSAIIVDFSQAPFKDLERGDLAYELTPQPEN